MSSNTHKTRPRKPGLLSKVSLSELKTIRIAVRRGNITVQGPPTPIVRSIDDPKQLVQLVHIKEGDDNRPTSIFDRADVQVNQEERFVIADANKLERSSSKSSTRSRSRTPARKRRSSRSRERRSFSWEKRSRSRGRRSRSGEKRSRSKEPKSRERRSRSREIRNDDRLGRDSRNTDSYIRPRRQSVGQDNRERRSRGRSMDRRDNRRSIDRRDSRKSEDRSTQRKSHSRERSRDRDKSKERYKPKQYQSREREAFVHRKRSPTPLRPGEYRPGHPDLKARSRSRGRSDKIRSVSRRTRSPSRDKGQTSSSSRRSRSPRYEKSLTRRASRSPKSPAGYSGKKTGDRSGERRWSRSPVRQEERKRSRSPHSSTNKHARRPSRSPVRPHGRYRPPVDTRSSRSRSPHPPIVTFNRPTSTKRRRSRSPEYDRDRRRQGRRSRSPARRGDGYGQGAPHEYGYFEGIPGADFWIPGPIRPSFPPMHRFFPPAYYARGFPPGTPIILPPRYPMIYPPNRPRPPVYYRNRPIRPATDTSISAIGESVVDKVSATPGEVIVSEVIVEEEKIGGRSEGIETNKDE